MLRWRMLPHNDWWNVYLHRFRHDDEDRALHDHPWASMSILLAGVLIEHRRRGARMILPWLPTFRGAREPHRLEVPTGCALTLFFTGPRVREWGFWCPQGWRPWRDFVDPDNPGQRGPGCD